MTQSEGETGNRKRFLSLIIVKEIPIITMAITNMGTVAIYHDNGDNNATTNSTSKC